MVDKELRSRVILLYKTLLYLGRDYPLGYEYFRNKTHNAFMRNKDVRDPEKIEQLIRFGEYITNELLAMYSLKKYRYLKKKYYDNEEQHNQSPDPNSNSTEK